MAGRQTYEARTTTKEGRGQRLRQPRFRQQRVPPKVVDRLVGTTAARRTRFSRRAYTRGSARRGRSADALSFDERSLVRNLKRPARRQTRVSRRRRRPEWLVASASAPALPRLRESSMCLLAARSAAVCKRTTLSVPWPSSHRALTPALLPRETNLAALVTLIYLCCFSRLCKSCPTTTAHSATVGRVWGVRPGVSAAAREVAAGGVLMDARRGT